MNKNIYIIVYYCEILEYYRYLKCFYKVIYKGMELLKCY